MLTGLLVTLLAMQVAQPTPTGVNDSVLGDPVDFAFRGPGKICFGDAAFTLNADETVYLAYSGIHSLRLVVDSQKGSLLIDVSNNRRAPKGRSKLVIRRADIRISEVGTATEFVYVASLKTDYSDGVFVPTIRIDGTALVGDASDKAILSRFSSDMAAANGCSAWYNFGWDTIFGNEPIVAKPAKQTE